MDKRVELLVKFGGRFFEYPPLIPLVIVVLTVYFACRRYQYLGDYRGERGFRLRRSVLAASAVVAAGLSVIDWPVYRYWGLPSSFADGQIGILVAEVPDQNNREQQPAYQTALRLRVQNSEQLQKIVKVRLIERPLIPDAVAQEAEVVKSGRWLRAAFVLRPFVVQGTLELWLTVVNPQDIFQPESSLGKFTRLRLATLDTLPLPADLAQLAETAFALTLSERHSYKEAAQVLGDVLKSGHLPEAATSRWALDHLRGDDLLLSGSNTEAIAQYKEALRLNPDFAVTHGNLGYAL